MTTTMKTLTLLLLSFMTATFAKAAMLERIIASHHANVIVTSLGEVILLASFIDDDSLELVHASEKSRKPVNLIFKNGFVSEIVDLKTHVNTDALTLGLRAEAAAKTPLGQTSGIKKE